MGIKMFWLRWKHKNEQDDDWAGQNVAIDGDGVSHSQKASLGVYCQLDVEETALRNGGWKLQ